jgi:NAD(P)H dehydrogenase (quinone)
MSTQDRPIALILGASGRTGSAVVRELVADPGPERLVVRAAARRPQALAELEHFGVQTALLDLDGIERLPLTAHRDLHDALAGVDRLFLLTGYSVDMLVQSKAIVDAARLAGVEHVVHMGAAAADDTTMAHLAWHQFVERYIEASGVRYTHLKPNVLMQNILAFGMPGGLIRQYVGDAALGWIDTDDVARAAASVLRSPSRHHGKSYRLSVEARSIGQVADILSEATGERVRYEARPADEWLAAALAGGFEAIYARCVHNGFVRAAERVLPDAADVFDDFEQLTGRTPIRWREHAAAHRAEFLAAIRAEPKHNGVLAHRDSSCASRLRAGV